MQSDRFKAGLLFSRHSCEAEGFQTPFEGAKFSGIYGGTKNKNGGVSFGFANEERVYIGLNYGPANGGLIVDPNRVLINFRDSFNLLVQ